MIFNFHLGVNSAAGSDKNVEEVTFCIKAQHNNSFNHSVT